MKALNLILITSGKISEATAHIWVVSISGDNTSRVYCKSPYKAMRYAFLLKKRTGLNISDNCLCRVSHEIARSKAPATVPDGSDPTPMQPRLCRSYHHVQAHEKVCRQAHYTQESQCYGLKLKERIARQKSKGGAVFNEIRQLRDVCVFEINGLEVFM